MARTPGAGAVPRVGLRRDPGLRVPAGLFDSGAGAALTAVGGRLQEEARRIKKDEERQKKAESEAKDTPSRKPPSDDAARRLRHGTAVAERRAQANAGRQEMSRAVLDLLGQPEDRPAAELPAAVKSATGAAMEARLAGARRAGLDGETLARLEADLGAHQLLLLEESLAEQAVRLRSHVADQFQSDADALVDAVRRDPSGAAPADAALNDLLADFAPGVAPAVLETLADPTRAALASARAEGLIAEGAWDAAEAALAAVPEAARKGLKRRLEDRRRLLPREDAAAAAAIRQAARAAIEAGEGPASASETLLAAIDGPEAAGEFAREARRATARREWIERLQFLPPEDWDRELEPLQAGPGEPALQRAQAGGDDGGASEAPRRVSERGIARFLAETAALPEGAFYEAATGLGLDPERALLFRDFLAVSPETAEWVTQRVRALRTPDQFALHRLLEGFEHLTDQEERLRLLTPHLKLALADRPSFFGGLGFPGRQRLGVSTGGRQKDRALHQDQGRDSATGQRVRTDRSAASGLPVGRPDPILTRRIIVQPVEGRRRLLQMAKQAKPDFDRKLESIAKSVPGTKFDLSRVKEDGDRLTFKIRDLHDKMRAAGAPPASPESGTHLIRDYLAGRLVLQDDRALRSILARIRKSFVVIDEKDFLKNPNPETGYTSFHLQLKHRNGLTMELQVVPAPFRKAAEAQRELFEKYRNFGGDIPQALMSQWTADMARSREMFAQAWEDWLAAGNRDPRKRVQGNPQMPK